MLELNKYTYHSQPLTPSFAPYFVYLRGYDKTAITFYVEQQRKSNAFCQVIHEYPFCLPLHIIVVIKLASR